MLLKFIKQQATAQEDIGFLPDFSNPRVISVALIAAVILAIMFALAATSRDGQLWKTLPLLILFMMSLTLSVICVLQISRQFLSTLTPKALAKARKLTKAQIVALDMETNNAGRSHICARVRGNLELIALDHIAYFLADQKYITVRHKDGEVLIEDALKNLEVEFSSRFLRIHRNALVNTNFISGMEKQSDARFVVTFKGIDDKLEISRRHVAQVRKFLKVK